MKNISIALLGLLLYCAQAQAATVGFNGQNSFVDINEVFIIDIIGGDDFPETQGGGVNLFYDPAILQVTSVSIDVGVWNFVNDDGTIDNTLGWVSDILVSAINPGGVDPMDDFIVATIEFTAIGTGLSALTLTESNLNPWATNGVLINPTFDAGSVTVATVPVPAATWLFGSGLIGLIGFARRKKA